MDLYGVPTWLAVIIALLLWLYGISYMGFLVFVVIWYIRKMRSDP